MRRKYQRLAEVLGYDLGFGVQHKLPERSISFIASRQANVLWPPILTSLKARNLRIQFIKDVVWYSGIEEHNNGNS